MKRWLVFALAFLSLAPGALASDARVETLHFDTPALAAPGADVNVLLPSGYDEQPDRHWPVVYLLHGGSEDHRYWVERGQAVELMGDRGWIVVMPDGGSNGFYTNWWNGGAGGPPRWEDFHIGELVPAIDAAYRTRPERESRAIAGVSMGGFGALSYGARHPDLFGAVASISGMADIREPGETMITAGLASGAFGSPFTNSIQWQGHNPVDLASNLRDSAIELSVGTGEPDVEDVQNMNATVGVGMLLEGDLRRGNDNLGAELDRLGIEHEYTTQPGVHHIRWFVQQLETYVIPFVEEALASPLPAPEHFDFRAIESDFSVWGWRFQVTRAAAEFLTIEDAGRDGLTLTGSGLVRVTTPPVYSDGRRSFEVDLGSGGTQTVSIEDTP